MFRRPEEQLLVEPLVIAAALEVGGQNQVVVVAAVVALADILAMAVLGVMAAVIIVDGGRQALLLRIAAVVVVVAAVVMGMLAVLAAALEYWEKALQALLAVQVISPLGVVALVLGVAEKLMVVEAEGAVIVLVYAEKEAEAQFALFGPVVLAHFRQLAQVTNEPVHSN